MSDILEVRWDENIVGHIERFKQGIRFSYEQKWIDNFNLPVSASLPCHQQSFTKAESTNFFINLLPEGDVYKRICEKNRINPNDIFTFLQKFGEDCAGALIIIPQGANYEEKFVYKDITDELEEILENRKEISQSLIAAVEARLSIAGAQDKLPVHFKDGRFYLPEEGFHSPTTAIIKPTVERFTDLHKNEAFCMDLAQKLGLPTAQASIIEIGTQQAYMVARYDREEVNAKIKRIHQEDFCQALGYAREKKYEENGGAGFKACNNLLMQPFVEQSVTARETFIKCAIFNSLIGNCDAHSKNFSLLYTPKEGVGVRLAPFYDLVSTRAYPDISQKFAMAIGKTFRFDGIKEHSWIEFSKAMAVRPEIVFSQLQDMTKSLKEIMEPLLGKHTGLYGASPIYEKLESIVQEGLTNAEKITDALTSKPSQSKKLKL